MAEYNITIDSEILHYLFLKVSTDSDFVTPKNTNLDSENVTLSV